VRPSAGTEAISKKGARVGFPSLLTH
jgi:hypothetical protein